MPDKTKRTAKILEIPRTGARRVTGRKTLESGGFLAEIYENDQADPTVYHYVVTRKGSAEILGWGQERFAEAAEREARNCMETLSRRSSAAG